MGDDQSSFLRFPAHSKKTVFVAVAISAEAEVKAANKTPVNVKTIEADFSVPSEALFKKIADELAQLDIAILVCFCFLLLLPTCLILPLPDLHLHHSIHLLIRSTMWASVMTTPSTLTSLTTRPSTSSSTST